VINHIGKKYDMNRVRLL